MGLLEVTKDNFICPENERHLYHCRIEVRKFNAETGERLSKPRMQVFGKKFFETFGLHNLRKQGYTVDVLYDPNEYLKETAGKLEEIKRKRAEEAKAAEREALKEEILAELAASGALADKDIAAEPKAAKTGKSKSQIQRDLEETEKTLNFSINQQ